MEFAERGLGCGQDLGFPLRRRLDLVRSDPYRRSDRRCYLTVTGIASGPEQAHVAGSPDHRSLSHLPQTHCASAAKSADRTDFPGCRVDGVQTAVSSSGLGRGRRHCERKPAGAGCSLGLSPGRAPSGPGLDLGSAPGMVTGIPLLYGEHETSDQGVASPCSRECRTAGRVARGAHLGRQTASPPELPPPSSLHRYFCTAGFRVAKANDSIPQRIDRPSVRSGMSAHLFARVGSCQAERRLV